MENIETAPLGAVPEIAAAKQDHTELYIAEGESGLSLASARPVNPLGHSALITDADGAADWSEAHPDEWIFPARVERRESRLDGSVAPWSKVPLCRWTEAATNVSAAARRQWKRAVGGGDAALAVSCRASGIWVLDLDRLLPADHPLVPVLVRIINDRRTLVRLSCTKGLPHFYFRQGGSEAGQFVPEGRWEGGDVKSSGYVIVGTRTLVDAPIAQAPAELIDLLRPGRRVTGAPPGRARRLDGTEFGRWVDETPDAEQRLVSESMEGRFLANVVDRFWDRVEDGDHRRMAALAAVHVAAIEAAAGLYSARRALEEIGEAYYESREIDLHPSKRWSGERQRDYLAMWKGAATKLEAGHLDGEIAEIRERILERYDLDDDLTMDEIDELFRGVR